MVKLVALYSFLLGVYTQLILFKLAYPTLGLGITTAPICAIFWVLLAGTLFILFQHKGVLDKV